MHADEHEAVRQVAFVDADGEVAVHTGTDCIREFGHATGPGFSVQANMMERSTVWDAMATAYTGATGDLPDRLLAALAAAQAEHGDIRGMQSAAIVVVEAEPTGAEWTDRPLELRVEDHPAPVDELHDSCASGAHTDTRSRPSFARSSGDLEGAVRERELALEIEPDHPEIAFWAAVAMAQAGRLDDARRTVSVAHGARPGWSELLRRVVADGQVELSDEAMSALLDDAGS